MKESSIKIFIPCHMESYVPDIECFQPIQVGTVFNNKKFPNMIHDDEGDNISQKNRMYCELTAHYWAWKHCNSDFIGFFHYRRYFNFNENDHQEDAWGSIIYDNLNANVLTDLSINDETLKRVVPQYDIIVPRGRTLPKNEPSLYKQYCNAIGQNQKDLDLMIQVLTEKYPEYKNGAKQYLYSNKAYECNMYIMRSELFKTYAKFAFDILFEVESRSNFDDYNQTELRIMGFLAERLFGIWYFCNKDKYKTLELQKTLFKNTDKPIDKIITNTNAVVSVLACNNYYTPYIAAMLKSIVENASKNRKYELYVLTTDISSKNQELLKNIVEIDDRFKFQIVNVKNLLGSTNLFVHTHISIETYYRFFILELFSNTEKVLYLDSDMVVNSDIADLFDINLGENYIAACSDIDLAGSIKIHGHEEQASYVKNIIGINGSTEYFQAGVLLFNIKKMLNKAKCEDLLNKALERNWNYMDQDILNNVFQQDILYLDQSWNVIMNWETDSDCRLNYLKNAPFNLYSQYLEARKNPKIVHFAGFQKPWDIPSCDFAEYFWKYARLTPFYEEILKRMYERANRPLDNIRVAEIEKRISNVEIHGANVDKRFDANERYLNRLKRTILWRGLRKIYRSIKK